MKSSSISLLVFALVMTGCGNEESTNTVAKSSLTPELDTNGIVTPDTNKPNNVGITDVNKPVDSNIPATGLKGNPIKPGNVRPMVPPITAPKTGGWTATPDLSTVAQKLAQADQNIKNLKNARFLVSTEAFIPEGYGINNTESFLIDQKDRFMLRYVNWQGKANPPHFEEFTVAKIDGRIQTFVDGKYQSKRFQPESDILQWWPKNHSHYLTSSIGTAFSPLTNLLAAAKKANWKITIERKNFETGTFDRVLMISAKDANTRYEIVLDAKRVLPVAIYADVEGAKRTRIRSQVSWAISDTPLTEKDIQPGMTAPNVKEPDLKRKIDEAAPTPKPTGT
jgi:hypothetical protein